MNVLDYIYPPRCPICECISEKGICDACRRQIKAVGKDYCLKCGRPIEDGQSAYCRDCRKRPHEFEAGRAVFSYQGKIRQSVYRLKYDGKKEYGKIFGREMARSLGPWIRQVGITRIVPVPLHPSRRRERGYNQAALMAEELGRLTDIPVDEKLLYRVRKTAPQKTLSDIGRRENLSHAFCVRGEVDPGERILLVDDIYTTGSTADAAAACIRAAAECRIYVGVAAIGG